tara:strand:+ start:411 stop:1040 length:630 start_codon:yes stop_codon:yes gene_type:complete
MTYRTTSINNIGAGSDNSINLSLENISNSNISSPQDNQILKFNSSNEWVNGNIEVASDFKLGAIHPIANWSSTSYDYDIGDYLMIRKDNSNTTAESGFTLNSATAANSARSNTNWFESINIPVAGKYLFMLSLYVRDGTDATWRMSNNAGEFGPKVYVKNNNKYGAQIVGIADCVQNDVFRVILKEKTGNVAIAQYKHNITVSYHVYEL